MAAYVPDHGPAANVATEPLKALLLQAFNSIRSERQLAKQIDFNLLFRWFVGLGVDDLVWHLTVFTKNRDRLPAGAFLSAVVVHAKVKGLLSDEHFSVDGTLIEAWASVKSVRPKDGSDDLATVTLQCKQACKEVARHTDSGVA